MYKVAKLIISSYSKNEKISTDDIDNLFSMLYKNGQILNNWIIEKYEDRFEARVTTTDDDSLDSKYFNSYIANQIKRFKVGIEIIADDALASDSCHCKEHSYYIISVFPDDMTSPIICGDCGREIPLIRIPYLFNEEEHYSILTFQSIYNSVDNLWMNSLSDRFSKRQIIDPKSQLNIRGLEIREELEKKTKRPVYLLISNPIGGLFEFVKNNKNLDNCPNCGGDFRFLKNAFVDKVCDKCRMAFITHDEK